MHITFTVPYFTYCIGFWCMTYKKYTKELFILQKKAITAINNLQYRDHTNDYFKSLEILKSTEVHKYKSWAYIYKTLFQDHDSVFHSKQSFQGMYTHVALNMVTNYLLYVAIDQ